MAGERNKLFLGKKITASLAIEPQLGRVVSCSGKLTPLSLDTSYSVGSVCTTTHALKLALSLYLVGGATVRFGHFGLPLFLILRLLRWH